MAPVVFSSFIAGGEGVWKVISHRAVSGEGLADAERLSIEPGLVGPGTPHGSAWTLRGVAGHARYVVGEEKAALTRVQPPLGRDQATLAAFIPIRKSAAWWELAQDERRAILEDRSQHIASGLRYLPAIARRLYQSRELGEPFDFLTWFEYAPEDATAFEELTQLLRRTEEWTYVEREVDVRLCR